MQSVCYRALQINDPTCYCCNVLMFPVMSQGGKECIMDWHILGIWLKEVSTKRDRGKNNEGQKFGASDTTSSLALIFERRLAWWFLESYLPLHPVSQKQSLSSSAQKPPYLLSCPILRTLEEAIGHKLNCRISSHDTSDRKDRLQINKPGRKKNSKDLPAFSFSGMVQVL